MSEPEGSTPVPRTGQNILAALASWDWIVGIILAIIAAIVFFKTTKPTQQHFDYTFRIAGALLHGHEHRVVVRDSRCRESIRTRRDIAFGGQNALEG